ncbi:MAG: glycosyltransferase, partial [Leptolyngbyaceae cyanobacterium]
VDYESLGAYFEATDVFIFPTLEDIWGMVVLEAMAFRKPVICSKWAGAVEMIDQGKTGYIVDPHNVEELAGAMRLFIKNPELISTMGEKSCQVISQHTPEIAAKFLSECCLNLDCL